jgi:CBS domain-containing protein
VKGALGLLVEGKHTRPLDGHLRWTPCRRKGSPGIEGGDGGREESARAPWRVGKARVAAQNRPTFLRVRAMTTVAEILKTKAIQTVHTVDAEATVLDAVQRMAEANTGALVVLEKGRVVGMVSERDCTRRILLEERSPREARVQQIMSSRVLIVPPDRTGDECMALMTENRLRHLPVMDGERLVGLVSIGDLVKQAVSEQKFVIEQLEHYITGA